MAQAHLLGRVARTETISLALTLPLRDPAGLQDFLSRLYDPADPAYGHYLTTAQFTERFGPTAESYQAVIAFAQAHGLTVTNTHPNRLIVDVSGTAPVVEAAFGIHLMSYRATNGHVFHAPDADPLIPAALAGRLTGIVGLENSAVWRPHLHRLQTGPKRSFFPGMQQPRSGMQQPRLNMAEHPNGTGSGPGQGFTPGDIKTAYNLNSVTQNGSGQTLALFELDGYDPNDIATYESSYLLPSVPLQNILLDGFDGVPGDGQGEVTLDIELMTALAPSAKAIVVYEAPNSGQGVIDAYSRIASDNTAKAVSTSWGAPELNSDKGFLDAESTIYQQMAAQGQSIYAAAGDSGAYDDGETISVDDPASQPFVTGVGGTTLTTSGADGPYQTEQAWGDPTDTRRSSHGAGGGGGISAVWPLPSYQTGFGQSQTQRNVPDVCLNADPNTGYSIYLQGGFAVFGGTSAAAPLWAAYTALVNQQRAVLSQATLGFANPTLYQYGTGASYAQGFHDIADGSTNLFYVTKAGYDNATGLGSFNGAGLLGLLAPTTTVTANPIASLVLKPAIVVGGLKSQGTVTLSSPAPTGGTVITIATSDAVTTSLPSPTVTVPAGGTTASFAINTIPVTGVISVVITATLGTNSQTATLTVTPNPGSIAPTSLSFAPPGVCGGSTTVVTLNLNGPAPIGGLLATIASDNPAASVPAGGTVLVPQNQTSVTFDVTTVPVAVDTIANISATANNVTKSAPLTVQTPALTKFVVAPGTVTGGRAAAATIQLTCPALAGGQTARLAVSNPSIVGIPASITFPAGTQTATIPITTTAVASSVKIYLTATLGASNTQTTNFNVQPGGLVGLTVLPVSLTGGNPAVGTLTLDSAAPPGGLIVSLASDNPAYAAVPATVLVPAGVATATFPVTTASVPTATTATITGTVGGASQAATLTLLPIRASGLTLNPTSVVLGGSSTGNLTINAPAPAGGLSVTLTSSAGATVPTVIVVPAGQNTATFTVTGIQAGTASVSVTLGGQQQTATLTILSAPGTTYPAGLNFISVPYNYSGIPLDTVFGFSGVKLAVWLPSQGQYALTPNPPADTLVPGRGYWVNLPHALTLTSVGTATNLTQDFALTLSPGWNQIGDPFPVPIKLGITRAANGSIQVPFDQASSGVPLLLSSLVYSYSPTAKTYIWTRDSDFLQPGQGYWVYAYQSITLTIPHPAQ